MAKSKFFRAFVAGNTISDGRQITPEMIDEIVETFNPDTYSPRINVEHIAGYSPEPPFNGYGTVIAVKAQDDEIEIAGAKETRRALYCQVDGNDQLVKLAKADQKPFPSVELTPSYTGTGKVGLVGLAFTDNPASIATQRLQFSRSAPGTIFASGDAAAEIEFEEQPADPTSITDAIKSGFAALAASFSAKPKEEPKPKEGPKQKAANDNDFAAFATAIGDQVATAVAAAVKPSNEAVAKLQQDFTALTAKLEATEASTNFNRSPATGGGGAGVETDC
ncbi:MAG TPA: GPO family capsid scaffolding protein [Allosphingosinicella sp.]|uniref:GPO family capsid scaffolding protein n=1 Tax=Allosphingosinicella sp. TaxID=2823234 RepID=UPI002ED950EA